VRQNDDDTTSSTAPSAMQESNTKNSVPDFKDARAAYDSKSAKELLRAAASFSLCKIPILVKYAESLLQTSRFLLGGTVTDSILKATMFGHFCSGEDLARIQPVVKRLDESGVGSILDYAAESDGSPDPASVDGLTINSLERRKVREYDYESESQCDKHVAVFKKCIHDVADLGSTDGFAAIKVTALGNPKLLAPMSQAISGGQEAL
jgi:proline dehydrogenase